MSEYLRLRDEGVRGQELLDSIKICVMGWGRHGKDTFSEMLGLPYKSSSEYVNELCVWRGWGEYLYDSPQACFDDRASYRTVWHQRLSHFNTPDKANLVRTVMKGNQIYCGLRCREELKASHDEGLFDITFWVDRSEFLPAEDFASNNITSDMCDMVISNNHTEESMKLQADTIIEMIKGGMITKINREHYYALKEEL